MAYHGCTVGIVSDRLNIRIRGDDKDKLRRAAEIERRSLSGFIKAAALEKAERLLSAAEGDRADSDSTESIGRAAGDST